MPLPQTQEELDKLLNHVKSNCHGPYLMALTGIRSEFYSLLALTIEALKSPDVDMWKLALAQLNSNLGGSIRDIDIKINAITNIIGHLNEKGQR